MGATAAGIKTLVIPAVLSLTALLLYTYVISPFWRRYRARYSQYLPLDSLSSNTASLSHRILSDGCLPALRWVRRRGQLIRNGRHGPEGATVVVMSANLGDDSDSDDCGEELGNVSSTPAAAREARAPGTYERDYSQRRLSRDLEEGFRDDSDEDSDDDNRQRRS